MRLLFGLPFQLPLLAGIGHGLKWPGFVWGPDAQPAGFPQAIGVLDQVFFAAVSGSVTSTRPSLRLRLTFPVRHQVRERCQV
jgi:hypothetical protein